MAKRKKKNNSILIMSVSLGAFILVTFIANEMILNPSVEVSSSGGRSPASIMVETLRSGTQEAERKLASTLSEVNRTIASIGKDANQFDQFRFGILEGKYAFTLDGEKIKDVSFVQTPDSEDAPTKVSDRREFLRSHSRILNIKNSIEKVATDIKGHKIIETYAAVLADTNKKITVQVEVDELDRLYHINLL